MIKLNNIYATNGYTLEISGRSYRCGVMVIGVTGDKIVLQTVGYYKNPRDEEDTAVFPQCIGTPSLFTLSTQEFNKLGLFLVHRSE